MITRIFIFCLILTIFYSCVKLDEGPSYSLFTKNQRLARSWELDSASVTMNSDTTFTTDVSNLSFLHMEFKKDGNLIYFTKSNENDPFNEKTTTWDWFQPGYMISTEFVDSSIFINGYRKYVVKRLTRNNLILEDFTHANRLYFHSY